MTPLSTRTRVLVGTAIAVGLTLRLFVAADLPRPLWGDEPWYSLRAEQLLGAGGIPADPYIRGPGTTWWIALVYWVAGLRNLAALGVANALLSAAAIPAVFALTRRVTALVAKDAADAAPNPAAPLWPAVAVTWAHALSPFDIRLVAVVASESVYVPLTPLFALACLRAAESGSRGRLLTLALLSAALLHVRPGLAPLVVIGVALAGWSAARHHRNTLRALAQFGGVLALTLALCVPWTLRASAARGQFVPLTDAASNPWTVERRGWWTWLSNVHLGRAEWLQIYWAGPPAIGPDRFDSAVFATADERAAAEAILLQARTARRLSPEVDDAFRALGEARIASEPVRFFVLLPTLRAGSIWLDPTAADRPVDPSPSASIRDTVLPPWRFVWRLLLGMGFIASFWLWRIAPTAALPGALVIARTVTVLFGFPLFAHGAKFEQRNLANVEPLALVALAGAATRVRKRDRDDTT